ncbi:asparagine synthase (glutamine-hydrolyzing) [Anaerobacillus sp. MEB173]|uniref:asparagine synthase (glutamine-hydrolyzing) n=1 Tax=Anaerobacillus sp. MEB173 TaxID=3383345 RepID=UPI003F8EE605
MCGFVGCLNKNPIGFTDYKKDQFVSMTNMITHRGPDDVGFYFDDYIQFGFRRLSIIDIESGKQPLSYEDDRYWIIFNGEIYNYIEIRERLENIGYGFKTNSDTEVIIALYNHKKEKAVKDLRGMFAFVIWDKENKELFGARDRFGIKPFFYMEEEDRLLFASEKKSILLACEHHSVNQKALHHYLTYQYVPEPLTMSESVKRLEPGQYFYKKLGHAVTIKSYWEPTFTPIVMPLENQIKEIRESLISSVKMHMRSDVPVGAFLSGGIDSTSIVALAKEHNPKIKTFTVGFERDGYSEIDVAKDSAERLGVENIHYVVKPEEFVSSLPKIIWHLDDPVADPAAVPLYFVAKEASKHVNVVLSGEGADELFGGYNIYREPESLKWFKYLPEGSKNMLQSIASMLPKGVRGKSFLERGCTPIEERFIGNAKIYSEKEKASLLKNYRKGLNYQNVTKPLYQRITHYHDVEKMQYIDLHTWLRGDILVKADKMTMAHSLELRVPFLDSEVFDVAAKIHHSSKIAEQTTKYVLRKAMEGIVPDSILKRKKLGFPVPIRHWLRDELYDWAHKLITESETDRYFNKFEIFAQLELHRQGKADLSRKLWTILVFMIWHQVYVEKVYNFGLEEKLQTEEKQLIYM